MNTAEFLKKVLKNLLEMLKTKKNKVNYKKNFFQLEKFQRIFWLNYDKNLRKIPENFKEILNKVVQILGKKFGKFEIILKMLKFEEILIKI